MRYKGDAALKKDIHKGDTGRLHTSDVRISNMEEGLMVFLRLAQDTTSRCIHKGVLLNMNSLKENCLGTNFPMSRI